MQIIRVYWRDIPSQIIVKKGRQRAKCKLPRSFQTAIIRAAMRAGKGTSAAYIDDWRRETSSLATDADIHDVAEQQALEFAATLSEEQLESLIKNKGVL